MKKKSFSGADFFKKLTDSWFILIGAIVSIQFAFGQTVVQINQTLWTVLLGVSVLATVFRFMKHSD